MSKTRRLRHVSAPPSFGVERPVTKGILAFARMINGLGEPSHREAEERVGVSPTRSSLDEEPCE